MRSERCPGAESADLYVQDHREVAFAQYELGMEFDTMTPMADQMHIYK